MKIFIFILSNLFSITAFCQTSFMGAFQDGNDMKQVNNQIRINVQKSTSEGNYYMKVFLAEEKAKLQDLRFKYNRTEKAPNGQIIYVYDVLNISNENPSHILFTGKKASETISGYANNFSISFLFDRKNQAFIYMF
ncbi:hypothetical protein [Flammeovirga aprica]|uniref:Uncharacterized protein n=1 Tax=Flammeovirga aprica JL-4 TaxID=694437 RepID=A0A7X9RSX8_9BACT|nr:hypothetical protein [Flammeovirga aprica]NME66574.1 hypothetical protein [Flammeovirga aprica JL-4]